MRAFKIVTAHDDGKLYSSTGGERKLEYSVAAVTVPREGYGPLAVFDKVSNAVRYLEHEIGFYWYESTSIQIWAAVVNPTAKLEELYCVYGHDVEYLEPERLPTGAHTATSVQLTKRVF